MITFRCTKTQFLDRPKKLNRVRLSKNRRTLFKIDLQASKKAKCLKSIAFHLQQVKWTKTTWLDKLLQMLPQTTFKINTKICNKFLQRNYWNILQQPILKMTKIQRHKVIDRLIKRSPRVRQVLPYKSCRQLWMKNLSKTVFTKLPKMTKILRQTHQMMSTKKRKFCKVRKVLWCWITIRL